DGSAWVLAALHLADAPELLRHLVEHEQRTLGDAKIGAVQIHLAALDAAAHEWKRHQILEAAEHRGLFDPRDKFLPCLMLALADFFARLDKHGHPAADEVARRQGIDVVDKGLDAAALRVAEHHDVRYPQYLHREFQRR